MTRDELLSEIRALLAAAHGGRLRGIVLYGSEARGEAGPDSDVDVLVLLDRVEDYGQDLRLNIETLYPLAARLDRRISAKPVDAAQYQALDCPLYRHVQREGIAA